MESSGEAALRRAQEEMITQQLEWRGITDKKVLEAFRKVPRHLFVDDKLWDLAYADHPLPIGEGQTISQPYIVALMTQSLDLQKTDRVLEIGTGSGYQTAILAELSGEVFTVELSPVLAEQARQLLLRASYANIHFRIGDGTVGWKEYAPYDKIIATGAVPKIPSSLIAQLREPGRLVLPVGGRSIQQLMLLKKISGRVEEEELCSCSFLPLIGEEGWKEGDYYQDCGAEEDN